jgi:GAF domain-containing protein
VAVALGTGALAVLAVLVALPLAAAATLSTRGTALAGAVALVAALGAGLPHDAFGPAHTAALVAVALAAAASTWLAARRDRTDRDAAAASFLSDASTLLSCSLDFDTIVKTVASLPVPELADWALVEVTSASGDVERRAASKPSPPAEDLAAALAAQGRGGEPSAPSAQLWPDLPGELIEALGGHEPDEEGEPALDAGSALVVPVRTVDRRVGTMTLLARRARQSYDDADMRRAQQLALRCAVAIDNAQAYRAARRGEGRFAPREGAPDPRRPS